MKNMKKEKYIHNLNNSHGMERNENNSQHNFKKKKREKLGVYGKHSKVGFTGISLTYRKKQIPI